MDDNARAREPVDSETVTASGFWSPRRRIRLRAAELGSGGKSHRASCKVRRRPGSDRRVRSLPAAATYPLHLGLTEAGMGTKGIVLPQPRSGAAPGGIGDTYFAFSSPRNPAGTVPGEVVVAQELLQTMVCGSFSPRLIACPGCGRTTSTLFRNSLKRSKTIFGADAQWASASRSRRHAVAVMGCVVTGPAKQAREYRHQPPGSGERSVAPVYVDGVKTVTLKGERIAEEIPQWSRNTSVRLTGKGGAPASRQAAKEDEIRSKPRCSCRAISI